MDAVPAAALTEASEGRTAGKLLNGPLLGGRKTSSVSAVAVAAVMLRSVAHAVADGMLGSMTEAAGAVAGRTDANSACLVLSKISSSLVVALQAGRLSQDMTCK